MTDTDAARLARMNEFAQRVAADSMRPIRRCVRRMRQPDPDRPFGGGAEGTAGQAPRAPPIHAGQVRISRAARVDPSDRRMPVATPLEPHTEARLMRRFQHGSPVRARALALAAIRETFEETGLLLGVRSEATQCARRAHGLHSPARGYCPISRALHFIGRAITPPGRPRRFDARFFTMDASAIAHRIDGVIGPDAELVELVWMPLGQARELDMPAVTSVDAGGTRGPRRRRAAPRSAGAALSHASRNSFLREML